MEVNERELVKRNYSHWGGDRHIWTDLRSFVDSKVWRSGVHSIHLPDGNVMDVYSSSALSKRLTDGGLSIPVFFSGALGQRRHTTPPYFSGTNIGQASGVPYLSISDPTLNLNSELGLAWYAGYEGGVIQDAIYEVLRAISVQASRHLLLVGGSGGGFASLYYGSRLGDLASSFVWNPQTSIKDYDPSAVQRYLDVAVPGAQVEAADREATHAALTAAGIESHLRDFRGRRLFYLQNYNDWHLNTHLRPFLMGLDLVHRGNGLYSNTRNQAVVISAFGEGHAVPQKALIASVVKSMLVPRSSVRLIYRELVEEGLLPSTFRRLPLIADGLREE